MYYIKIFISIFIILFLTTSYSAAATQTFTIQLVYVDVDATPFQVGEGTAIADPPGIAVELVIKGIKATGNDYQLIRLPQKRMLKELELGNIDGAFIFSYTPERALLYAYPLKNNIPDSRLRVTNISYCLYRIKGTNVKWNGNHFSNINMPIGANKGWVIVDTLKKMGISVDDGGKGYKENFYKLRAKYISAYAGLEPSADAYLSSTGQWRYIEKTGPPIQSKDYFLIFSKKFFKDHPETANSIWNAVAKERKKNEKSLYKKYLNN